MREYLQTEGHDILQNLDDQGLSSLDILAAMIRACLISPSDLSQLRGMVEFIPRSDLAQQIDEFNKNNRIFKKVPFGLRNLPRDMVERPSEVNELLKLLDAGNNSVGVVGVRSGDVIGIRGMGGLGKTVLAQAIAWSAAITRQVVWLDIGQTPDCLALINVLVKALGGTASFSNIEDAQMWLRANTVSKDCLVVLDDVWNVEHASVFDFLSGKCQLLITTRDADVVRGLKSAALYELQTMAQDKSRKLLYQSANVKAEQSKFSPNMKRIVVELLEQCRGLPLALSLVGSNLTDTRVEQDWQDILDDLKNADLAELRSLFPTDAYPHDNLLAAINVSYQRLERSEQQRFLDFAIFPEDTDIPSDMLELFWSLPRDGREIFNPRAGRRSLSVLERKSLIQKGPEIHGKNSYRVHDLILDFARGKCRETITDARRMFLDALRSHCKDGEWPGFQGNKDYYFKYLPYHIHSSEEYGELLALFFNYHWLDQKVKQTNLPSLISDFRFLGTASHEIKLLKSSLMLSADVIEKHPDSIGLQLLGRLLSYADEHPSVNKLLELARKTSEETRRLIPLFPCLSEPEGALIRIFRNHSDTIFSLVTTISANGTIVISALADGSIKVHELETGRQLQLLEGHTMAVYCLALSHSGTILASGSYDSTARLWNLDSYDLLFELQAGEGGYVNALDFSEDDKRLFTGSNDGNLREWDVNTGGLISVVGAHDGQHIRGMCTTKDGSYIVTASHDSTIKLWRADTLALEATLNGHTATVYCVVATSSEDHPSMLVSASGDKTLKIWELTTYQEIRCLRGHQGDVYCVAVTPDSKYIISGGQEMIVRLWCFNTGKLLFSLKGHSQAIRSVTVVSDGTMALSGSQDKSFRVWDLDTDLYTKQDRSRGHAGDVIDIAVARDGSRFVSSSMDGTFKVWNCETAEECFTFRGVKRRAVNVSVSDDCRHVVTLGKDATSSIKVWDLILGSDISGIERPDNQPRIVRFSPDGKLVVVGCNDDQVFIWDWRNYDVPLMCITLPVFTTMEIAPAFATMDEARDKNMIKTCSRNMEVFLIDLKTQQVVQNICQGPCPKCTSMVVLPDAQAILSGIPTDSSFIYWELTTSREIRYNAGHPRDSVVTAIDITSNGKLALSGSSSGTMSLMDLESSNIVQTFQKTQSGASVRLVSILKDDERFVFVDEANRVELRLIHNNNEAELELPQPSVVQPTIKVACATPLGSKCILLGCENGEVLLYDCFVGLKDEHKYQAHSEAITQVKSHPSNEFAFFVSGSVSGSVKFWYVTKTVPPFWSQLWSHDKIHANPITTLAFVPKSEDIVIGSYGSKVHRINAAGIVQTYKFKCHGIAALRAVGASLIAVCIHSFSIVQWRLADGQVTLQKHGGAGREQVVRINHESERVASKGPHHSLLLWDFKTGATYHKLRGHTNDIRSMAVVPGDEFLLSGARDKTLKLWDLKNGEFLEEFHFEQYVRAIACATDGTVCVGLQGGHVCVFRIKKLSPCSVGK
ncbi:apoptotic protease-activating factor 1-like isoform X2 [Dendronephthya gigantea]|nr:apoptotic protease-activating factor 1-like isoform X2 [Dendronephthya gigantea]